MRILLSPLIIFLFLLPIKTFSQESWSEIELVDDFGDKTGKVVLMSKVEGKWIDKSTDTKGVTEIKLVRKKRFIEVSIYLDGTRVNFSKKEDVNNKSLLALEHLVYGTCNIKFPNGSKQIVNAQSLYLWDYSFAIVLSGKLKKALKISEGEIDVVVNESVFNAGNKKHYFKIPK